MRGILERLACGLAISLFLIPGEPALALPEACSCENLESLQEELENAIYEANFFADMAAKLQKFEHDALEAKKDPSHPDSNIDVEGSSLNRRDEIMKTFKLPHWPAKGYEGPESVKMTRGTCEQPKPMLDAMRDGSQCQDIADITLRHEELHRKLCNDMGAVAYWARLPGVIAAEEAERYKQQADEMRAALKRVIDIGTITVEAELEPRVYGPQFDVTYSYVTPPMELDGKSSPGSDSWTLDGKGNQAGTIKRARIAGMNCTATGQLNDEIGMKMETDGLSMRLDTTTRGKPGDIYIRCKKGFGMSLRPDGEVGSGRVFADKRVEVESNFSQDVKEMSFAQILTQGGMSVSGKHTVKVKLACPPK